MVYGTQLSIIPNTNLRGPLYDNAIVDDITGVIKNAAATGATSAVQPYVVGALALSLGALLLSFASFMRVKALEAKR